MHYVYLIWAFLFLAIPQHLRAQGDMLSMQELQDSMQNNPKPVLLMLHTDWCSYCALQKTQISKRKHQWDGVYLASFDAESKDEVEFGGKTYSYIPQGNKTGTHALALKLMEGRAKGYPNWILLDEKMNLLDSYAGYLKPKELDVIVKKLTDTK